MFDPIIWIETTSIYFLHVTYILGMIAQLPPLYHCLYGVCYLINCIVPSVMSSCVLEVRQYEPFYMDDKYNYGLPMM